MFRLNPDLDPFKGDLLRTQVIRPIEDKLDLLAEQIHEAPEEEPKPEPPHSESAQENNDLHTQKCPQLPQRSADRRISTNGGSMGKDDDRGGFSQA